MFLFSTEKFLTALIHFHLGILFSGGKVKVGILNSNTPYIVVRLNVIFIKLQYDTSLHVVYMQMKSNKSFLAVIAFFIQIPMRQTLILLRAPSVLIPKRL